MDARLARAALLVVVTLCLTGADYRTENFIVRCSDPAFGKQVAQEAERFRRELAIEWLGEELAPWRSKCPIVVKFERHASGRTSFSFQPLRQDRGYPVGWDMEVCGPRDRILDAVLPHEITHAIFATHFGQPLPRWADEGACTTVEHESERIKHKQMLVEFLMTRRGIPFNRMFRMMQYPRDMLPLYAQGHSVADFLIQHEGKRHFVDFVDAGLDHFNWDQAVERFYGYEDLSDLQLTWNEWVRNGSEPLAAGGLPRRAGGSDLVAANDEQPIPPGRSQSMAGSDLAQAESSPATDDPASAPAFDDELSSSPGAPARLAAAGPVSNQSWYFAVMREHAASGHTAPAANDAAFVKTGQGGATEVTYRRTLPPLDRALVERINPSRPRDNAERKAQTELTPIPLAPARPEATTRRAAVGPLRESRRPTDTRWR